MTTFVTINNKGQITLPKKMRDILQIKNRNSILVNIPKGKNIIELKKAPNFVEVAKSLKIKSKLDPVEARALMHKQYERK